ncbi:MAG: DUF4832 domain-containing protein [Bacteroides sp.]|nr:DUF4832 domain-containing protein [Bacteroides sp.]
MFPNPERGFYKYTDSKGTPALSEQTLRSYRQNNVTLIYRLYYLKDFKNAPISDAFLSQIKKDMEVVRKAGIKIILRFAYSLAMDEPDALLEIILQHLEQVKPILQEDKDVIALLQAGFIGAWREWYYTTNNLNNDAARKAVLDKILNVLPVERTVQVRTPNYKRNYIGAKTAIQAEDAYSGKPVSRIGHHNDCFMTSIDDYGAYTDATVDKNYLNAEGLYLPIGGEICPPDGVDPADCDKAQAEMRNLRWSYLNEDYYRGVNDNWIVQGCMDGIIREMGYRFALQKGEFSEKHAPGSELYASITVQNLGYTSPFNPRKVELILRSKDGKTTYVAPLSDDPRTWKPYKPTTITAKVALPTNLPTGDYKLYLFLPDPESAIHDRPEYAIRLGNQNCWEETTGYNDLGVDIQVSASSDLPASQSSVKFTLKK